MNRNRTPQGKVPTDLARLYTSMVFIHVITHESEVAESLLKQVSSQLNILYAIHKVNRGTGEEADSVPESVESDGQ